MIRGDQVITDLEEDTLDLDWFCVDDNDNIGHFATGGRGFLPPSVKASKSNLDVLTEFFLTHLSPNGVGKESLCLTSHLQFESDEQKARCLYSFLQMGAKGLYSFDCVVVPFRPCDYFKIIEPSVPVVAQELPSEIQRILNMTRYVGKFCSANLIKVVEVG